MTNGRVRLSRRKLLSRSLGSALAVATTLRSESARAGFWGSGENAADVIVVGAGGAGLAAALSALEAGASVIVLEKLPMIGGNTLRASGLFNAADPERQSRYGIKDSVEWHFDQTMKSSGGLGDPKVVRRFVAEALPTLHWLESLGISFQAETVATWGAEWPRGHKPFLPRGTAYIRTLSGAVAERGGSIRTNCAVRALIREKGRITGVEAKTPEGVERFTAGRAVVLAAGGYAANPKLLADWAPSYQHYPTDNSPGSTGDLILAAGKIGAKLVNLDCVQLVPGSPADRGFQVRLDLDAGRSILIDGNAERFADEVSSRAQLSEAIRHAAGDRAFVVTDNAAVDSYDLVSRKDIYRGLQTGDAFRADTIEKLAAQLELPAVALRAAIEAFNREAVSGSGKCAKTLCRPIGTPPFWGSPVVLNLHSTMGGVAITPDASVLDESDEPIRGLFAAGEMVGNLHGENRIGGNGIASAITMGRIAGLNAAAAAIE